jgi:predicted HicB family RNase H-like nuclease
METSKERRLTLRIPKSIYRRLEAAQKTRPHLSMNALIVEAISRDIGSKERSLEVAGQPSQ